MQLFGIEISLARKSQGSMTAVDTRGGWFSVLGDFVSGAWQAAIKVDAPRDIMAFSGVFSCVTKIANDVAKLRPMLVEDRDDGTCLEVEGISPFRPVLEKPNRFQTRITFFKQWIASKLFWGNAYVLKERDRRGLVIALYILDPQRVTPLVTESGDVYYRLQADHLSGLKDSVVAPASEIIHDLMVPLWHPLVGVSPIYACGTSATMGSRILRNSTAFFGNMSRPGGYLVTPGKLEPDDAAELKRQWKENYGGANAGNTAVLANGLKYENMGVPADDAQLIEQLEWTIADVARCFAMPLYKIGGEIPPNTTVETLNQSYYSECLQILLEDLELCLKEGLSLPAGKYVEFDLDGLLRMDASALIKSEKEAAGIKSPNESRRRLNLPPVEGGKSPYLQEQNFSLEALAKRDASPDPWASKKPPAPALPAPPTPAGDEPAKRAKEILQEVLAQHAVERAAAAETAAKEMAVVKTAIDEVAAAVKRVSAPAAVPSEEMVQTLAAAKALVAEFTAIVQRMKDEPAASVPAPAAESEEADLEEIADAFIKGIAPREDEGLSASATLLAAAMIQEEMERTAGEEAARLDRIEDEQRSIARGLQAVAKGQDLIVETLRQPVVPVYDDKGKLKHAQRQPKDER